MKVATTAQTAVVDIGPLLPGEAFIFLYINTLFPTLKALLCTDMASQIATEMVPSPVLSLCIQTLATKLS
jgi:hypothetical protein